MLLNLIQIWCVYYIDVQPALSNVGMEIFNTKMFLRIEMVGFEML